MPLSPCGGSACRRWFESHGYDPDDFHPSSICEWCGADGPYCDWMNGHDIDENRSFEDSLEDEEP